MLCNSFLLLSRCCDGDLLRRAVVCCAIKQSSSSWSGNLTLLHSNIRLQLFLLKFPASDWEESSHHSEPGGGGMAGQVCSIALLNRSEGEHLIISLFWDILPRVVEWETNRRQWGESRAGQVGQVESGLAIASQLRPTQHQMHGLSVFGPTKN